LHPWLGTPEAAEAAKRAVRIPVSLLAGKAVIIGLDELQSEALAILTECALPPRERLQVLCARCGGSLDHVRRGAKFCSRSCKDLYGKKVERGKTEAIPARPASHIGSMWTWPEAQRIQYAVREVGYILNNWLRTRHHVIETPSSDSIANMDVAGEQRQDTPREALEAYLESKGFAVSGEEPFDDLYEAACWALGYTPARALEAA
jgi:hypothetical protein